MHQAFEGLKLAQNLRCCAKARDSTTLLMSSISGVKFFQGHFEAALQAHDFNVGDSACAAMTFIGVDLETTKRQHDAGKKTRRCAGEQVHGNTHGGAERGTSQ